MNVTILRGISGSGKTTFAEALCRSNGGVRVSRDDLRRLLFGVTGKTVLTTEEEKYVTEFQRDWIERELDSGRKVVIDDTNLHKSFLKSLCRWINDLGYDFEIVDFKVDLDTAVERNARRADTERVPEHVIKRQFQRAWWGEVESKPYVYKPYVADPGLPQAITCDLDGTLAHMNGKRGPYDTSKYHLDDVDEALAYIERALSDAEESTKFIILTGREEKDRAACEAWLDKHGVAYDHLIMRPTGDMRNDGVVKSDLWDEHIDGKFDVLLHFDDRKRVVNALRKKGIKVAQVAPGNF